VPLPDDQEPFIGQGRYATNKGPGPARRLLFAAIGLIAGDAALLIYMMYNALRACAALLMAHMGQPYRQLTIWVEMFLLYAMFSILGWALVGLPFALAFPVRLLSRIRWPLCVLIGAALGPLALLLIFVVIFAMQGRLSSFSLAHTEALWQFSVLVSTVSFLVYVALLRRRSPDRGP
jgi:hypothetical protein